MAPSSPRRDLDGEGTGGGSSAAREKERPRSFDEKTRSACWRKAAVVMGRHPERWRQDAAGNVVCRRFWSCHGCLCYEYDHIVPFSKGASPPSCPLDLGRILKFSVSCLERWWSIRQVRICRILMRLLAAV
jgi:hypothetical protein